MKPRRLWSPSFLQDRTCSKPQKKKLVAHFELIQRLHDRFMEVRDEGLNEEFWDADDEVPPARPARETKPRDVVFNGHGEIM